MRYRVDVNGTPAAAVEVTADEVTMTDAGAIVFSNLHEPRSALLAQRREFVLAFAPGCWRRCDKLPDLTESKR